MIDAKSIQNHLKNTAVIVEKNSFTYVNRLFQELGENPKVFMICKSILSSTSVIHQNELSNSIHESLEATEHDVTGSPLRHSFGENSFNVTIVRDKKNWAKDEESYVPVENNDARVVLNMCLEYLDTQLSMPLFVLCDGLDKEKTVLLGAFMEKEWFSTMKVCIGVPMELTKVTDCSSLMQKHLTLSSVPEREINIAVSSTYEFHGINSATIDWTENERINFEGYLSMELNWNSLSFLPPARTSSSCLITQIAAGWKDSPLNDLWTELSLLNRYLTILEAYQKKNVSSRYSVLPLIFPKDFGTPYIKKSEHLLANLNLLLSGDDDFAIDSHTGRRNERLFESNADLDENALLRSHLNELSSRQNRDFTDQLWQLIIGSSDYAQMTDCLHTVFEEIVGNHYKPQINGAQPTRLASLIDDLNTQNATVPLLAGSLPLELVIDIGMEKMCRDYKYLLLSANLADSYDIRDKLCNASTGEFTTDKYRELLITMAQIHICLEFLLLMQNNLDCALDISYSFFDYAMKIYTSNESPIKSFVDLAENTIYTLQVPGSNAMLKEISKAFPSTWRATLSSKRTARKFVTTTHYSLVPIFPPNIYAPIDTIEGEEHYHVTNTLTSSYQISYNGDKA